MDPNHWAALCENGFSNLQRTKILQKQIVTKEPEQPSCVFRRSRSYNPRRPRWKIVAGLLIFCQAKIGQIPYCLEYFFNVSGFGRFSSQNLSTSNGKIQVPYISFEIILSTKQQAKLCFFWFLLGLWGLLCFGRTYLWERKSNLPYQRKTLLMFQTLRGKGSKTLKFLNQEKYGMIYPLFKASFK